MSYNSVNYDSIGLYNTKQANNPFKHADSSKPSIVYTLPNGQVKQFTFTTLKGKQQIVALLKALKSPTALSVLKTGSKSEIRQYFKSNWGVGGSVVNQLISK